MSIAADEHEGSAQVKGLTELMAVIAQSPSAGLGVVELAGELMAENARFNQWAYDRKTRSTARDLWNISAILNSCASDCLSAWRVYSRSGDKAASRDVMLEVLRSTTSRLRESRLNEAIEFDDPSMPEELRE